MKLRFLSVLLVAVVIFVGCEKDDGITNPPAYTPTDSTWSDGAGGYNVRLNATGNGSYRYYDLSNRQVVEIGDNAAHTNGMWQIAFSRYLGKLNGGASGVAAGGPNMMGVDLAVIGHADSVRFDSITSAPAVDSADWKADEVKLAVEGWYNYDFGSHTFTPSHKVFIVKTASGKYAKFELDSLGSLSQSGVGLAVVKYVYQADGSTNLSGSTQTATLVCANGVGYFWFATGGGVSIASPATSTAWDFMLSGFDVKLNCTINGPGAASAMSADTTFEAVTAPPAGAPFFQDSYVSVFGTQDEPRWFNYVEPHELVSKNHVYLLRTGGGTTFKLQIKNYYMIVNGASQGGWIQFRFKQL